MKRDLPDRTKEFALRVIRLCQVLDEKPGINRALAKQLLRSGTSIGANVAEMGEIDSASFSFRYDGDWSKGEYWIGYDNLKNDFNWFFDGLEKAYHLVLKNQGKQTGVKQ